MTTMAWDLQPRLVRVRVAGRGHPTSTGHARVAAPARRTVASSRPASVRLTPRGRLVVTVTAAVLGLVGLVSAQSATADSPATAVPVATHTVVAGETLWEIAGSFAAPGEDRRDVVAELVALNGLPGAAVQSGQQILVPMVEQD